MKVVVICGSMKFKEQVIKIATVLENLGYEVKLPTECINGEPKEIASRAHFNRIVDDKTDAILVVNMDKPNLKNYIGPNSFAEIAFAFYFHKKIFLLNDVYEPYKDELTGWQAVSLESDINNIKRYL